MSDDGEKKVDGESQDQGEGGEAGDGLLDRALNDEKTGDDSAGEKPARPDYVPEAFWDAEKGEVRIDKMALALKDTQTALRGKQQSRKEDDPVPEKAADYFADFTVPDNLKDRLAVDTDDPLLSKLATWAHGQGIGPKAVGDFLTGDDGLLAAMADLLPAPLDPEKEAAKLGRDGNRIAAAVGGWLTKMEGDGLLAPADMAHLRSFGRDAQGMLVLSKLMASTMGGNALPMPRLANDESRAADRAEWEARHKDSRYVTDEAFRAATDALGQRLFPEGQQTAA